LLGAAGPHLQRVVIAALESCCRVGELLQLQWRDLSLGRGEIHLRPEKTKTRMDRIIPISTRLRSVLEMARNDPAGHGRNRLRCAESAAEAAILGAEVTLAPEERRGRQP
jgi:integrase